MGVGEPGNYPGIPGQEGPRKCLVYSLHDNAIGTKHIGGAPHQNRDTGNALALDGLAAKYENVYLISFN